MSMNPRHIAVNALIRWRREGSWPDLYLREALEGIPPRDAGLASSLTYGVLQQRDYLDFIIGSFSTIRLKKITPQVLDILRVAAYQIVFLDKVPDYAIVTEAVTLTKKLANPRAAGFVNALLRKLVSQSRQLPQPSGEDRVQALATLYSHPLWLTGRLYDILGDEACEALLRLNNTPPVVTAQINTLKTDVQSVLDRLGREGLEAVPHADLPHCLELSSARGLRGLLEEGLLYIQDAASQLCVHALAPTPGAQVLDLCAAPGGKTLLAAQLMEGRGSIVAGDLHAHKVRQLEKTAAAYGIAALARFRTWDAAVFDPALDSTADFIICDVPCSGFGIIRKKPDVRYKSPDGLEKLPQVQYDILVNAARYLKPGGTLVYSTCTLLPEENQQVTDRFLREHGDFCYEAFSLPGIGRVEAGQITLWPHLQGTDGFYLAKIRKK